MIKGDTHLIEKGPIDEKRLNLEKRENEGKQRKKERNYNAPPKSLHQAFLLHDTYIYLRREILEQL